MSKIKEYLINFQSEHDDNLIIQITKDLEFSELEYYATQGRYNK